MATIIETNMSDGIDLTHEWNTIVRVLVIEQLLRLWV